VSNRFKSCPFVFTFCSVEMIPQSDLEMQDDPLVTGACEVNMTNQEFEAAQNRLKENLEEQAQESDEESGDNADNSSSDLTELMHLAYVKRPRTVVKSVSPIGRCDFCGTDATPMWRRGPKGCSTLCNACGVKWKNALIRAGILPPKGRLPKSPKFGKKKFVGSGMRCASCDRSTDEESPQVPKRR
jgi:hypothetical protein